LLRLPFCLLRVVCRVAHHVRTDLINVIHVYDNLIKLLDGVIFFVYIRTMEKTRLIYSDYFLIRLWGENTGLTNVEIQETQKDALKEKAPLTAVYPFNDGWVTLNDFNQDEPMKEILDAGYNLVVKDLVEIE